MINSLYLKSFLSLFFQVVNDFSILYPYKKSFNFSSFLLGIVAIFGLLSLLISIITFYLSFDNSYFIFAFIIGAILTS